jgi:hypothetical protein
VEPVEPVEPVSPEAGAAADPPDRPLLCGGDETFVTPGRVWHETREGAMPEQSGCWGASIFWTRDFGVTKKITAVDGAGKRAVRLVYDADGSTKTGGESYLVERASEDAGAPVVRTVTAGAGLYENAALGDALSGGDPANWPIPPGPLRKGEAVAALGPAVVRLLFPVEHDGPFATGGRATVRYTGTATRPFGHVRSFAVHADLTATGAGMCHHWTNHFIADGTFYFAVTENVLVEAELVGRASNATGSCQGCGKNHQEACPEEPCPIGKARYGFRVDCTPVGGPPQK